MIVTDNTSDWDHAAWKSFPLSVDKIHNNVSSNEEIVKNAEAYYEATKEKISKLYVSGHGAMGGVSFKSGSFNSSSLSDDQKTRLKCVMTEDAEIVLYACGSAEGEADKAELQSLSNSLSVKVIANEGTVISGANGFLGQNMLNEVVYFFAYDSSPWKEFTPKERESSIPVGSSQKIKMTKKEKKSKFKP